ncbi:MAG: peptidoglycan DD-metalloendopeptidase family protein [Desulfuromonadaceae bacterium]|nr:peptidoglycan DD-metalloendopeptidase family protein [Desulfuromonadaceae bacterium]
MISDLKPPNKHFCKRKRWVPILIIAIFFAGVTLLAVTLANNRQPDAPDKRTDSAEESIKTIKGCIKPSDTISSLLGDLLSPSEIHALALKCRNVHPIASISIGQPYKISLKDGNLKRFSYDIDSEEKLVVCFENKVFSASREPIQYTVKQAVVRGTIKSSLFQAVIDAGESESLALQLADIFAWDINFFQDIQAGDSFEVVVEKRFRDGQPTCNGRLLAANFTVQDKTHRAFYFQDGNEPPGYYDINGGSLRKAFLKAPLSYRRISSGFSMHRRHPITNRITEHTAIDYAAPTGTPVHTVGNGTVTFASYKHYNGNCVKILHSNGWTTMYNHLSRFGKNVRRGTKVKQGQFIGYVGSTGSSTGPHLDFRMYKNGRPVNPLKINSPPVRPVSRANLAALKSITAELLATMENQPPQQGVRTTQDLPVPKPEDMTSMIHP